MRLATKARASILDFDVECRPLSWYGGDWVTKEITAIAWAWVSPSNPAKVSGRVECRLLGEVDLFDLVAEFQAVYAAADIVTGHYIRGFDLPLVNGACLELGLAPLGPTMAQDTKGDLVRFSGLSKSQENLGAMLGLRHPKVGMNQETWRAANRLTPEGIEGTRKRVVGDVKQHVEMRAALLDRGMLGPPRPWSAGVTAPEPYQP